jgi:hypothetical protein
MKDTLYGPGICLGLLAAIIAMIYTVGRNEGLRLCVTSTADSVAETPVECEIFTSDKGNMIFYPNNCYVKHDTAIALPLLK